MIKQIGSQKKQKARIDFAPDGKHWQEIKKGGIDKLWDYFVMSPEIRQQIFVNPFARFRLIGDSGLLIGTLPKED